MQVDSIKTMLKAPGSKRLKLEHENTLSNFAFKFISNYTSWPLYVAPQEAVSRAASAAAHRPESAPSSQDRWGLIDILLLLVGPDTAVPDIDPPR